MRSIKGLVLVAALVVAVVPAWGEDHSDLAGRAKAWESEYNAGKLDAVAALYTADGCRMPPNAETANGGTAILGQLKAGREQGIAQVKIAVTSAESSGDLSYGTGTYEILSADGKHVDRGGETS